jgi:hypothetical protein
MVLHSLFCQLSPGLVNKQQHCSGQDAHVGTSYGDSFIKIKKWINLRWNVALTLFLRLEAVTIGRDD